MFPIWKFSQSTHPAPNLNASGCVRLSSLLRMQRLLSALYSADLSTGEYFAESNHAVKVEINLNKLKIFSMFFFTKYSSRPAGEVLLQETQTRTLRPRLDAVHLLVVEPLQEAAHHPLEGPAPLRLAQRVKLALLDAAEADLLIEVDPWVWLELVPPLPRVRVDREALTSGVLVIWNRENILLFMFLKQCVRGGGCVWYW